MQFFILGEITLVALAPLTNIALALRLDPDFGSKLKEVFIMGGNIEGIHYVKCKSLHNLCSILDQTEKRAISKIQ